LSWTILVASAPVNSPTPAASRLRRPMPVSLSQINRRGTTPSCSDNNAHMPESKSAVVREGIIDAVMNFENDATITSTGNIMWVPSATGILGSGNHKSHCTWSPGW
jgi:hypothetical protein